MAILEREVGVPLLLRVPRGIQLTDAGKLLADLAARLLTETAEIEDELRRFGQARARWRLARSPPPARTWSRWPLGSSGGGTLTCGSCSPRRTPTTWSPSCTARVSRSAGLGLRLRPAGHRPGFRAGRTPRRPSPGRTSRGSSGPRASERSPCAISRRNRGSSARTGRPTSRRSSTCAGSPASSPARPSAPTTTHRSRGWSRPVSGSALHRGCHSRRDVPT